MKIALTASSQDIDSEIDPRFGRSAYLLVVDPDTLELTIHSNPGATATGGAGIVAAQSIDHLGVEAVVSGDFGPNAYNALHAAGISMYLYGDCLTIHQAIEHFKSGQLKQIESPTRAGHHG
jgi:predicted Fe-Mo cluster-binding NifX family protein